MGAPSGIHKQNEKPEVYNIPGPKYQRYQFSYSIVFIKALRIEPKRRNYPCEKKPRLFQDYQMINQVLVGITDNIYRSQNINIINFIKTKISDI